MNNSNPWKGLNAYSEGDTLYGRNKDIISLSQYIMNNSQTILFGKSGIGKTSILNAGVFPIARRNGLFPVSIRFDHTSEMSYVEQISKVLKSAGLKAVVKSAARDPLNETLWEFMHRQYFVNKGETEPVHLLLVIDQFEEIFTLQKEEGRKRDFFAQLSDLLNDICPLYKEDLNEGEVYESLDIPGSFKDMVSLDDFSFDVDFDVENYPDSAGYIEYPEYHIVFTLREDFLASLERYTSYIPVMKNNRFALEPLNEEQAAEIIMKPSPGLVDKKVAEHIIQKVTGCYTFSLDGIPEIEVDSALLSLYLSRIYEKKSENEDQLTDELINECGNDIIKDFYIDAIKEIDDNVVSILEMKLLTHDGCRNNVSRSDLKAAGVTSKQINKLAYEKKILRQFKYGNDNRIELIHDILCPIVLKHREEREIANIRFEQALQLERIIEETRQANQQRVKNDLNVLTVRGRKPVDNSVDFGYFANEKMLDGSGCDNDDCLFYAELPLNYYFRYYHHDNIDMSAIGKLVNADKENTYTTCIEYKAPDGTYLRTIDGINKMEVEYAGELIKEIKFFKYEKDYQNETQVKPFYLKGFCAISIEYDELGREICRVHKDEKGLPVMIYGGYSIVKRSYDDYGNLSSVRYFDEEGRVTEHWNGNHGYVSEYNEYGLETRRVFINRSEEPTPIKSGIYARNFEYDEEGRLAYIENLGSDFKPIADCKDYISVAYRYDEFSRLTKISFLDENRRPKVSQECYSEVRITYGEDQTLVSMFFDENGCPCADKKGAFGESVVLDDQFHLIKMTPLNRERRRLDRINSDEFVLQINNDGCVGSVTFYNSFGAFEGGAWLKNDNRNLFILYAGPLEANGQKKSHSDDTFGIKYERDDKGVVCAKWNIDIYNQVKASSDGIAMTKVQLEKGKVVEEQYFDFYGNPHPDEDGNFGNRRHYSDNGELTTIERLGISGNPSPDKWGVMRTERKYDEEGRLAEIRFYDSNGTPCSDEKGVFGESREYQTNPRIERYYSLDANGDRMNNSKGYCYLERHLDDKGRDILKEVFDSNGIKVPFSGSSYSVQHVFIDARNQMFENRLDKNGALVDDKRGIASVFTEYDELGRKKVEKYYNSKEEIAKNNDIGAYGIKYDYSENGREEIKTYLDAVDRPCVTKKGFASIKTVFDSQGRDIEYYYYDEKSCPIHLEHGFGIRKIYTEKDNRLIFLNLDKDGSPLLSSANCYAVEKEFDKDGRVLREFHLDADLNPMPDNRGKCGVQIVYDDESHSEEMMLLDADGQVLEDENGAAYVYKSKDNEDRLICECLYDKEHTLVKNTIGVFNVKFHYPDVNTRVVKFFDEFGVPMRCGKGWAGEVEIKISEDHYIEYKINEYDQPLPNGDGIAGEEKKLIQDGKVLCTNLGEDLKPIADAKGFIAKLLILDNNNRIKSCISLNENGEPNPCKDRWIRCDYEYDSNGNSVGQRYFDADNVPMKDSNGYYGIKVLNSEEEDEMVFIILDAKGEPQINKLGSCYFCIKRDSHDRKIRERQLDNWKNPIYLKDGCYGHEFEYRNDGKKEVFFLDSNGTRSKNRDGAYSILEESDDLGRVVSCIWLDESHDCVSVDGDIVGYVNIYNDAENSVEKVFVDEHRNPHTCKRGYSSEIRHMDVEGRVVREYKKTVEGELYVDKYGTAVTKTQYDNENIHHYYVINESEDGVVVQKQNHEAYREYYEDEQGRVVRVISYNANGDFQCNEDGCCEIHYTYEEDIEKNIVKTETRIDSQGNIIEDQYYHAFKKMTLDRRDRPVKIEFLNSAKNQVQLKDGGYACLIDYYEEQKITRRTTIIVDENNKPQNNKKGYSKIIEYEDDFSNVEKVYFGVNGNIVNVNECENEY